MNKRKSGWKVWAVLLAILLILGSRTTVQADDETQNGSPDGQAELAETAEGVPLSTEAGSGVVYVGGAAESGDGSSRETAFATLAEAYAALDPSEGGTIVVCGDITVKAYKEIAANDTEFKAKGGHILLTGKDPVSGMEYGSTLTIKSSDSKSYATFLTETEISYLTVNADVKNSLQFITGPSLTFGEGVVFQYKGKAITGTKDQIVVRVGCSDNTEADHKDAVYVQKSGTLSTVYGGLESNYVGNLNITIGGTAELLVRLQGAATNGSVEKSTVNITDSAKINQMYIGGYTTADHQLGASEITISGGIVEHLSLARSATADYRITGNISVNIGGTAEVQEIIDEGGKAEGSLRQLIISGERTVKNGFGTWWSSIEIEEDSTVDLTGAYKVGAGCTLQIEGTLYVESQEVADEVNQSKTGNGTVRVKGEPLPSVSLDKVYLGGENASDDNSGETADKAVATFDAAYAKLKPEGGTIVVCGTVEVEAMTDKDTSTPFPGKSGEILITGKDPDSDVIYDAVIAVKVLKGSRDFIWFETPTEFSFITINALAETQNSMKIVTGPSLTFGESVVFRHNGDLITWDTTSDLIVVRLGSLQSGITASYTQKSGTLSAVYGGSGVNTLEEGTITLCGTANVTQRVQGGATNESVKKTTINISDNARIKDLFAGGYPKANSNYIGSAEINISGGRIESIQAARANKDKTYQIGSVNLKISGVAQIGNITWGSGTKRGEAVYTLTFETGVDDMAFTAFGDGNFWDHIILKENVKLHLNGEYTLGTNVLTVEDGAILFLSPKTNTQVPSNYEKYGTGKVVLDEHTGHELIHVDANCAYGGKPGNIAYWYCNDPECPGYKNRYIDSEGAVAIGTGATEAFSEHRLSFVKKKAAGCLDGNIDYWLCEVCGRYFADGDAAEELDGNTVIIKGSGHNPVYYAAQSPNCTEDGWIEHWHCENCGWDFSDSACTQVYLYSVIDPKLGHGENLQKVEEKAATCTENGNIEYWECTDCGKVYTDAVYGQIRPSRLELTKEEIITRMSHTLTHVAEKNATCTENGNIEYWYCEIPTCGNYGKYFADAQGKSELAQADLMISAHHRLMHVGRIEATVERDGNTEYWYCEVCGKYFADAEGQTEILDKGSVVIPKLEAKPEISGPQQGPSEVVQPEVSTEGVDTGDNMAVMPAVVGMFLSMAVLSVAVMIKKREAK